jgi:hypothetical protein
LRPAKPKKKVKENLSQRQILAYVCNSNYVGGIDRRITD